MKSEMRGSKDVLKGLSRKNPKGDSGMRPSGKTVDFNATRSTVGKGHSIGGRTA